MKIEFYHIDAMEAPHYEPIWRALLQAGVDARLVAVPGRRNAASAGWFDFERLQGYYQERGVPFRTTPDHSAHAVTTQNCDILARYRGARLRLMYGPVLYPQAWGLSEQATRPFDAVLVHGDFYRRHFSRWHSVEDLLTVGYPRFDDFFTGDLDTKRYRRAWGVTPERKTLVYLPTWGENSSLDRFLPAVSRLAERYRVLVKPHHCTLRFEPQRSASLARSGLTMVQSAFDLPALYACADLVLADARSAVCCEAAALGRPVVGLVTEPADLGGWLSAASLAEFVLSCSAPEHLEGVLERALAGEPAHPDRANWAADQIAFRDGSAAQQAAQELMGYLERHERERPRRRGMLGALRGSAAQLAARLRLAQGEGKHEVDTFAPYRSAFYNEANRRLVRAAQEKDLNFLVRHLVEQDCRYYENFPDEEIEVRTGLKIVCDEIERSGKSCTVVDIACGNCSLLKRLAGRGHRVIGVDASPVRVLKNRPQVKELFFGMAEDLPLPEATADVVVATEALEHVFDAAAAVSEIARVLKPGGVVYCQVPEFDYADGENHLRHFSPESLSQLFSGQFRVESLRLIPYLEGEPSRNIFLVARKCAADAS